MKLKTIWTLPGASLRERLSRTGEEVVVAVAWRLPSRLVYWTTIRAGVHASTGRYSDQVVPELTLTDVLKRWPAQ